MSLRAVTLILALTVVALVFSIASIAYSRSVSESTNQRVAHTVVRICESGNESRAILREYVMASLDRSEATLPTLDYYREHPDELAEALNRIAEDRKRVAEVFVEIDCSTG